MTTATPGSNTPISDTPKSTKFKVKGWLVVAAILLPMLSAYLVFKTGVGMPEGTMNKGELLLPATSITDIDMYTNNGEKLDVIAEKKLWRMFIVSTDECAEICRKQLYLSRQVHIRLGEKAIRVERIFLNAGAPLSDEFKQYLKSEHPRLTALNINPEQWRSTFKQTSIEQDSLDGSHVYYVDQEGFAMMSYNETHEGADLLSDIKRLLKYSYEE
jgi:hypothetical protein